MNNMITILMTKTIQIMRVKIYWTKWKMIK